MDWLINSRLDISKEKVNELKVYGNQQEWKAKRQKFRKYESTVKMRWIVIPKEVSKETNTENERMVDWLH